MAMAAILQGLLTIVNKFNAIDFSGRTAIIKQVLQAIEGRVNAHSQYSYYFTVAFGL